MSVDKSWKIIALDREDTLYSGPEGEVLFAYDPLKYHTEVTRDDEGRLTYVVPLSSMRFEGTGKPVPFELAVLIAERVGIYTRERGMNFYAVDAEGWCDDHLGHRWPGFSSTFPTMRHASGWSFTDTRWGQNEHEPWVEYRDTHGAIRLGRQVGYSSEAVTCVLYVPSDFRESLIDDDGTIDDEWFERARGRIESAYDADTTLVTFVQDTQGQRV